MALSEPEELEMLRLKKRKAMAASAKPAKVDDTVPGTPPQPKAQPEPSLSEKAEGALETGLGTVAGIGAAAIGSAAGVVKGLTGGKLGTPEGVREADQFASDVSGAIARPFQPHTPTAQDMSGQFGQFLESTKLAGLNPSEGLAVGSVRPGPVAAGVGKDFQGAKAAGNAAAAARGAEVASAKPVITPAQNQALETLERFAKDPDVVARAKTTRIVEGSKPTLAETTENPGLAQLQRAQQSKSPALASDLAETRKDRLRAREGALEGVAGSEGEMEYYKEARNAITEPLYKKAYETPINPKLVTPAVRADVKELMQRPTLQEARAEAIKKARDSGENLSEQDLGSVRGMHWMKRVIDDKIGAEMKSGNNDQVGIYMGIQEKLIGTMQQLSPAYAKAMAEYQEASKPINRMKVGQYLKEKLFPASNQYGTGKMTVGQFAKALEHGDQTAKLATGFSGAKLENILTKDEIAQLKAVAKDVVREQNVESAARVSGSPTAQLSAAQARLQSVLDKLEHAPSGVVRYPAKAAKFLMDKAKESGDAAYEAELNKMLLNPAYARSVAALRNSTRVPTGAGMSRGFSSILQQAQPTP